MNNFLGEFEILKKSPLMLTIIFRQKQAHYTLDEPEDCKILRGTKVRVYDESTMQIENLEVPNTDSIRIFAIGFCNTCPLLNKPIAEGGCRLVWREGGY